MVSLVFAFIVTDPLGLLNGLGESGKYQEIQRVLKNTKSNKVLYMASYDNFYEIEPNFLRRFEIGEDFAEAGYNDVLTAASLGDVSFNNYLHRHGVTHIIVPLASSATGFIFHKWATLGSISINLSNPFFEMETSSAGAFPVDLYRVLELSDSNTSVDNVPRDLQYRIDWNSLWGTWFGVQRRVQEIGMYAYDYSYTYVDGPEVSWVFQDPVQPHQPANFRISTPHTTKQKFAISITFVAAYGGNAPPQTVRVSTPSANHVVSMQAGVPGKVDFIVHNNQQVVIDNVLPCRAAATFSPGDLNPLLFCYGISDFTVRAIP